MDFIRVDLPASHVFRITLARPETRNAQNTQLLYELNAAEDAQGRRQAMQRAFALRHLARSHQMQTHGMPIDPGFLGGDLGRKSP